jgi:hypothetical protein
VIDGDPSGWYDEVEQALVEGAEHKITGEITELERSEFTKIEWDTVDIDW